MRTTIILIMSMLSYQKLQKCKDITDESDCLSNKDNCSFIPGYCSGADQNCFKLKTDWLCKASADCQWNPNACKSFVELVKGGKETSLCQCQIQEAQCKSYAECFWIQTPNVSLCLDKQRRQQSTKCLINCTDEITDEITCKALDFCVFDGNCRDKLCGDLYSTKLTCNLDQLCRWIGGACIDFTSCSYYEENQKGCQTLDYCKWNPGICSGDQKCALQRWDVKCDSSQCNWNPAKCIEYKPCITNENDSDCLTDAQCSWDDQLQQCFQNPPCKMNDDAMNCEIKPLCKWLNGSCIGDIDCRSFSDQNICMTNSCLWKDNICVPYLSCRDNDSFSRCNTDTSCIWFDSVCLGKDPNCLNYNKDKFKCKKNNCTWFNEFCDIDNREIP